MSKQLRTDPDPTKARKAIQQKYKGGRGVEGNRVTKDKDAFTPGAVAPRVGGSMKPSGMPLKAASKKLVKTAAKNFKKSGVGSEASPQQKASVKRLKGSMR
jgi:hypothetical protein